MDFREPILALISSPTRIALLGDSSRPLAPLQHRRGRLAEGEPVPGADELGEEPPLGVDLVDQDGPDGVRLLVRPVIEQVVEDRPPHARRPVGLAGVGRDEMLEQGVRCLRHLFVWDGDEFVANGRSYAESDVLSLLVLTLKLSASLLRLDDDIGLDRVGDEPARGVVVVPPGWASSPL
jgi:hypothetical protein